MKNKGGLVVGIVSFLFVGTAVFFIVKALKKPKLPQKPKGKVITTSDGTPIGVEADTETASDVETTQTGTKRGLGIRRLIEKGGVKPIKSTDLGLGETVDNTSVITTTPMDLGNYKVNDSLSFKKGQYSEYIKAIQSKLGITSDGKFGNNTYNAVVKFQRSKGLTADGIVGKNTWKALFGDVFPNT
jgi:peptidoglycan hydrolase-like protein with peptidoglycan-binding domain